MTPEGPRLDRRRLDGLVLAAAALAPSERRALFDRLPEDERHLAAEARRRLEAAETLPEGFLEGPATELLEALLDEGGEAEPSSNHSITAPPSGGERYDIGECLGSGGMARVYRAFDRHLGRPVALKILHTSDPATPERLLREARAQARVRHNHVLDVYETGELDGRPYIAMRYVEGGRTLDGLDNLPSPPSPEGRVRLLAQVAWGLHAAHREGLLHGDVKPSNVLVDATPDGDLVARIGDFGIATDLLQRGSGQSADGGVDSSSGSSSSGGALGGTPQFMAPELLRDPTAVDRRSDVYSLGVTLHRVLTGKLPARGDVSWHELRDEAAALPRDLAAVIARCLARDPGDRYPSARALAEDLHRFLDGEVVQAHAEHLTYRIGRFVARHRALVTVTGIAALLLAAALVVAAALGVQAMRANELADRRRAQAEELIGFTILDLRDKLEPVGRLDLLDDVGHRAMRYFAAVPEGELSDEELSRRSTALYQIGDVRMRRGDLAGAERPFEESLALARELLTRDPSDAERLFGLGQSEFWAGYAAWERGDPDAARPHFEAYHEISERLVARDPESLEWRRELSYALSNLGSLLEAQGDLEGALERFRAALVLDRELVAHAASTDPEEADAQRFELAATHNTIGLVLEQLGRLDEAQEHFEADVALRQALVVRSPDNQRWREQLGTSRQFLGNLLVSQGRPRAARAHLEAARDLFDELAAHDPDNGDWRFKQAWSHLWLGRLEHAEGGSDQARAAWARADGLARDLAALDSGRADWRQLLGATRYHLALAEATAGSADVVETVARSALDVLAPLAAERPDDRRTHRWLAETLLLLGDTAAMSHDPAAAERFWTRAAEAVAPFLNHGSRHPALVAISKRVEERSPERAAEGSGAGSPT